MDKGELMKDNYDNDFTANVGVNLTQDLVVNEIADSATGPAGENDAGGTGFGEMACPPRQSAFAVYYDQSSKSLKMVEPQVIVCGKAVECEALAQISDGTYYCNVRRNTTSSEYEAKIEDTIATDTEDIKVVCSVKLFNLDGESFTHYHAGAIMLYDIGAKLTLQNKESTGSIVLDASGDSPKLVVSKEGKSISLDLSQIPDNCEGGVYGIKSISWLKRAADGKAYDTEIAHFIGCYDVDLTGLGQGSTTLSTGPSNSLLTITGSPEDGYKLSVPSQTVTLTAGEGISVSGTAISNDGVLSVAAGDGNDGIKGKLVLEAGVASGLVFSANDKTITLDVNGRADGEGVALRDVTIGGSDEPVARVFGTTDFEIAQKKIAAGDGISVSDDGETVTISATGTSSGDLYSGERKVLADVDFSSPDLRKRFYTETWENGVLVKSELGNWQSYHTSVEETT